MNQQHLVVRLKELGVRFVRPHPEHTTAALRLVQTIEVLVRLPLQVRIPLDELLSVDVAVVESPSYDHRKNESGETHGEKNDRELYQRLVTLWGERFE